MWRRDVSRGDDHVVRPVRLARVVSGSAWPMFPYLFTRIPAFECRSASRPRQGVVHQLVVGHLSARAAPTPPRGRACLVLSPPGTGGHCLGTPSGARLDA
jgi:hypothetical protein